MSSIKPALKLWRLIQSHRTTAVIYVAAKLGIAELLRNGSRSLAELAEATGADKQALGRLLIALSTVGVCSLVAKDRYSLTEMGTALDGAAESSFRALAIFEGQMLSKSWNGLLESIMTGKTAAQLQGLSNSFDLMARSPEAVSIFNAAMVEVTRFAAPDILSAYDFGRITHLMDVGGGSGQLVGLVVKQYPQIRGTVFDLPRCAESAKGHFDRIGVSDRIEFKPGDFFQEIPSGADAIIMKSIIHDWNDERSLVILGNCRKALPESGILLLVERLMPEVPAIDAQARECAMSDLNMLRGPGGSERTETEYRTLAMSAGFVFARTSVAGSFSLIQFDKPAD
jgi:hypothetical protein